MESIRKKPTIMLFSLGALLVSVFYLAANTLAVYSAPAQDNLIPLDSSFTYQGYLEDDTGPINTECDFQFDLYDAATAGNTIGSTNNVTLTVDRGVFATKLDFGNEFATDERWLSIGVRCPAGSGTYTTMTPRTEITGAPLANALPGVQINSTDGTVNMDNPLEVAGTVQASGTIYNTGPSGSINVALRGIGDHGELLVSGPNSLAASLYSYSNLGGGILRLMDADGNTSVFMDGNDNGDGNGFMATNGPNGNANLIFGTANSNPNEGSIAIKGEDGVTQAFIHINSSGEGIIEVRDGNGATRALMDGNSDGAGYIETEGPNGNNNVALTYLNGFPDNGYISAIDSDGNFQANLFVKSSGEGAILLNNTAGANTVIADGDVNGGGGIYSSFG